MYELVRSLRAETLALRDKISDVKSEANEFFLERNRAIEEAKRVTFANTKLVERHNTDTQLLKLAAERLAKLEAELEDLKAFKDLNEKAASDEAVKAVMDLRGEPAAHDAGPAAPAAAGPDQAMAVFTVPLDSQAAAEMTTALFKHLAVAPSAAAPAVASVAPVVAPSVAAKSSKSSLKSSAKAKSSKSSHKSSKSRGPKLRGLKGLSKELRNLLS